MAAASVQQHLAQQLQQAQQQVQPPQPPPPQQLALSSAPADPAIAKGSTSAQPAAQPSRPDGDASRTRVSDLVLKLRALAEGGEHHECLQWLPQRASIHIANIEQFAEEVLPRHFAFDGLADFAATVLAQGCYRDESSVGHNSIELRHPIFDVESTSSPMLASAIWRLSQRETAPLSGPPPAETSSLDDLPRPLLPPLPSAEPSRGPQDDSAQDLEDCLSMLTDTEEIFAQHRRSCEHRLYRLCQGMISNIAALQGVSAPQLASDPNRLLEHLLSPSAHRGGADDADGLARPLSPAPSSLGVAERDDGG